MSQEPTKEAKDAAEAALQAAIVRQQEARDARGPNPLLTPAPRYPQAK